MIRWKVLFGVVGLLLFSLVLVACQPATPVAHMDERGTVVGYGTQTALEMEETRPQVTVEVESPTSATAPTSAATATANIEPTPQAPSPKLLDWSNLAELKGSTFEFFTATHNPANTQPFTGWVSAQDLSEKNEEQPKGSIGIFSDTDPTTYVTRQAGSMIIFVTCRELNPQTGQSANNKRTLIFAVLEGSPKDVAYYVPEILTVHSFNYRGDARVDWGEQFKLLGNQGHPEDTLWPVEGAFVLHLANGETLKYNYVAGLNIHYPDEYGISGYDVQGTKTTYADQLKAMLK